MARKPNYRFERKERDRRKAEKIADQIHPDLKQKSCWWYWFKQYLLAPFFPSLGSKQIGRPPYTPEHGGTLDLATDTITFEVLPWDPAVPGAILPIHCLDLVMMGLTQGQNFDLEELAADCAADAQYDFLLEASPQPFVGGVGSPVNPVAIK